MSNQPRTGRRGRPSKGDRVTLGSLPVPRPLLTLFKNEAASSGGQPELLAKILLDRYREQLKADGLLDAVQGCTTLEDVA